MKRGVRVPTSDPHTIHACWSLFLLSVYLLVAEAASFDKKELCRSDTKGKCVFTLVLSSIENVLKLARNFHFSVLNNL